MKLTENDVLNWLGGDNTLDEAVNTITRLVNNEYPFSMLKKDIEDYRGKIKNTYIVKIFPSPIVCTIEAKTQEEAERQAESRFSYDGDDIYKIESEIEE